MSKQELYRYVLQILKNLNVSFIDPCSNYASVIPGPFDNDAEAAAGGVAIGQEYFLTVGNTYGITVGNGGIKKTRMVSFLFNNRIYKTQFV